MSKVWFVTGAGSGIGAGTVRAALRAGDRVVATARNLDKLRKALGEESESLALVKLDVTDEGQVKTAVDAAMARFGRIDVVVNNAGYSLVGNFEELSATDIEQQLKTNLYGVMYVMRTALPVMRKQRSGHIINISSCAGVMGFKHCGAYSASKFGVEGLSLSVAQEVEPFGIKITIIEPGFFRTDLLDADNVKWATNPIDDYAAEGSVQELWAQYNGTQQGDPNKLGDALVQLSRMEKPPKVFVAGRDALAMIPPSLEERLQETRAHPELSKSTDGQF